jgi:hypothetical protein
VEFYTLVLPILVISEGTLWVADYAETGDRIGAPVQVNETTLFIDRKYEIRSGTAYHISHLHIFTRSGFVDFLQEVSLAGQLRERMFGFALRQR